MEESGIRHTEGKFRGYRNLALYYQKWLPVGTPKAVLLLVHGLFEHSGRYTNLVNYFVPRGYAVQAFDQQGHGKSEGLRGFVTRFSDYLIDLKTFSDMVRAESIGMKFFLTGHSMGGTVATAFTINYPDEMDGLILSAPLLQPGTSINRLSIFMAQVLSALIPKMGIATINAFGISRDKAVVDAYKSDPLVYHGKIRSRLGAELFNVMMKELPSRLSEVNLPLLVMHGTADKLVNPEGCELLYKRAGSKDKTLKSYAGLHHEIFNEPEHQTVMEEMEAWLKRHI